jgi:hypothetical protein
MDVGRRDHQRLRRRNQPQVLDLFRRHHATRYGLSDGHGRVIAGTLIYHLIRRPEGGRPQASGLIAATIMTGASVLISGFSIGLFYLPAGIAMLIVACVEDSAKGVKRTPSSPAENMKLQG